MTGNLFFWVAMTIILCFAACHFIADQTVRVVVCVAIVLVCLGGGFSFHAHAYPMPLRAPVVAR